MAEVNNIQSKKKSVATGAVPLSDIIYRTLHHWPWVLLSLFVCVGTAIMYLLCTPKIFTTTASILIKDNANNNTPSMSVGGDEFANMGLFQNKTNIQNEMTTFMSADLMKEAVKRLKLDINYYKDGTFHKEIAYGYTLPVCAELIDFSAYGALKFDLMVTDDGNVTISDMKIGENEVIKTNFSGKLNDTIKTEAGTIVILPTDNYTTGELIKLEVDKMPLGWTVATYSGNLMVSLNNKEGTVIDLTLTDRSTQRAQDLLNTLISVYNEYWISDKNQVAVSTSNFINERLGVIEGELGHVDSDISSYKSENLIPDVDVASTLYMGESQRISQEIMGLKNQLQMTRYIRNYLSADNDNTKLLPIPSEVENVDVKSQLSNYNDLILQRNSLVAKSSEKNPLVISIDEQLTSIRSVILKSIDNSITALQSQISSLNNAQVSTTSKIASNPTQAKHLLSVERQQKVKESLYLFLLQKREENELSQAFTAYNTRVIRKPASWGPTAPNSKKIVLASIFLGLAIPFGIVFLLETNNTRVRGRKDVEHLAVPFLGEIPQYTASSHSNKSKSYTHSNGILVKEGTRNIINEAFRVLRTNVEFMCNTSDGHKIIALTSFNPGSGKSFISINLGMSLALKGRKVLVIDGDMRHGSTSTYVESPTKGLSNYLSGVETNINALIVRAETCNDLDVLPIGAIPPNPTELLESKRFETLIATLKPNYDYIIIDCPPIEVVADAQIIDRYTDRTFFIIRAGLFERSMLPELDRLYEEKKYANMAFILNGTRNDQGRYGYSHSYHYGYGYGYGYGYNYGDGK